MTNVVSFADVKVYSYDPTFTVSFVLNGKEEGRETGSMVYAKINCLANKYFKNNDEDCDLPHNKVNNDH